MPKSLFVLEILTHWPFLTQAVLVLIKAARTSTNKKNIPEEQSADVTWRIKLYRFDFCFCLEHAFIHRIVQVGKKKRNYTSLCVLIACERSKSTKCWLYKVN